MELTENYATNLAPIDQKGLTHEPIINWSNIPEKHGGNLEEEIVCGFRFMIRKL